MSILKRSEVIQVILQELFEEVLVPAQEILPPLLPVTHGSLTIVLWIASRCSSLTEAVFLGGPAARLLEDLAMNIIAN